MNKIYMVDIDNITYIKYKSQFISYSTDNVTFNYLIGETSSYVTKLTREDKDYDRDATIKHKDLHAEIKEIDCPF